MVSLNDVLLAMSNIPVDDPIAEIWGRGLQSGYKIIEYTGSFPITINANGDALLNYQIYGENSGVGVATENLFNIREVNNPPKCSYSGSTFTLKNQGINYDIMCKTNGAGVTPIPEKMIAVLPGTYTLILGNGTTAPNNSRLTVRFFDGETLETLVNQVRIMPPRSFEFVVENNGYVSFLLNGGDITISDFMLVKGSPAPTSYIPYGYKLPMTVSDGNTAQNVPVYIGENQLDSVEGVSDYVDKSSDKIVRMIGEYTFTGDEAFATHNNYGVCYTTRNISPRADATWLKITMRCDHQTFTAIENRFLGTWTSVSTENNVCHFRPDSSLVVFRSTANFLTAEECQAYLKAQYDNGTPVKISYWLNTPIEEISPVPLPEIPTIDGTTIIDYDGEPKPSQMYIKYKGKG